MMMMMDACLTGPYFLGFWMAAQGSTSMWAPWLFRRSIFVGFFSLFFFRIPQKVEEQLPIGNIQGETSFPFFQKGGLPSGNLT